MYGYLWYTKNEISVWLFMVHYERWDFMFSNGSFSNKPLYKQIVDETKGLIAKGMLKENDKMPSVREFAKIKKVNISTIQKAYQQLENEKIITTIVGKGTFITNNFDNIKPNYKLIDTLIEDLVREAKVLGITKEELLKKISDMFEE